MKNILSGLAVALAISLGSDGAANAEVLSLSDWTGSATTGYTATFGKSGIIFEASDLYTFNLPLDASGNFTVNVYDTTPLNGAVDYGTIFLALALREDTVGFTVGGGRINGHQASLYLADAPVPGNYILYVDAYPLLPYNHGLPYGNQSTSYAGNIFISPVPEPATYAMMLAGLGLIGFSARRKLNNG